MAKEPKDPLLFIVGATGTGKSQLAIELALRFNGEIINGDAMQMYAGLPIITNQVRPQAQKGIPHHLLGCIALHHEPWTILRFRVEASRKIKEIRSRGKLPIVVGGSHYYTQSLLKENGLVTPEDLEEGEEMTREAMHDKFPILKEGPERILEELEMRDPRMAKRWHPNDVRKIKRSLEICLATGRMASEIYEEQRVKQEDRRVNEDSENESARRNLGSHSPTGTPLLFWVHAETQALRERLDKRVDDMVKLGLIDEAISMDGFVRDQESLGFSMDQSSGIWASIGFKEMKPYLAALKSGSTSQEVDKFKDNAVQVIKTATRQYARQQVRWIRLQLMKALSHQNQLGQLYLLDSTHLSLWSSNVSERAITITKQFLKGTERPLPSSLSELAKEYLDPAESTNASDVEASSIHKECAFCHVVAVREDVWLRHLRSRRHRALARKAQKRMAMEESLRSRSLSRSIDEVISES